MKIEIEINETEVKRQKDIVVLDIGFDPHDGLTTHAYTHNSIGVLRNKTSFIEIVGTLLRNYPIESSEFWIDCHGLGATIADALQARGANIKRLWEISQLN